MPKVKFNPTENLMAYNAPGLGLTCYSAGEYECSEETAQKVIGKYPENFSLIESEKIAGDLPGDSQDTPIAEESKKKETEEAEIPES